ncbi:hypothetical protein N2152v2_001032 [Parachlorella kessleri]
MTCADIRPQGDLWSSKADEPCYARPRGYKRGVLDSGTVACLVYRPGNGGHAADQKPEYGNICPQFSSFGKNGFACDQDLQRRTVPFDAQYDSSTPYAVYKRGRGVCVEWPSLGHGESVPSPIYPQGTPYSVGPVYILASKAQWDSDPSEKDFWNAGGGKPFATLAYDDCSPDHNAGQGFLQHSYYNDTGPLDRARPCRGCFTIPASMEQGLWVFQWLYEMNKDEWYTTCWDAVISDTGDSYTAPPAKVPSPHPRSGSLGSAGTGSTYGWSAAPLNQVSSSLPKCPAGMSGPLCTPSSAGAGTPPSLGRSFGPPSPSPAGATSAGPTPVVSLLPSSNSPSGGPSPAASPPAPGSSLSGWGQGQISATGSTVRPPGASLRAPQIAGYEVVQGQELHGLYDYSCPGSISTLTGQECQHDGQIEQLIPLCNADPNCQVIAWYQFGSGGRTTPTAWFKGGPTPQDVHAFSTPPNPDAVLYIKQEVTKFAGLQLREQLEAAGVGGHLCVYTSPFSRTLQTAQLAASQLGADSHIQEAVELRERHFGDYELQSCSNYETVWAADAAETSARPPGGGESVQDVAARMKELIARLERSHQGYQILLVSHGDALSILAAVMLGTDLQSHRQHGLPNCGMLRIPAAQL